MEQGTRKMTSLNKGYYFYLMPFNLQQFSTDFICEYLRNQPCRQAGLRETRPKGRAVIFEQGEFFLN